MDASESKTQLTDKRCIEKTNKKCFVVSLTVDSLLVQYLYAHSLSSQIANKEKTIKTCVKKGIERYFPNTLYLKMQSSYGFYNN